MAKRKKKRDSRRARAGVTRAPQQNQSGVLFAGTDFGAMVEKGTAFQPGSTVPNWFLWAMFLWYPMVALLAVYGHKYGYSPDLHMSSLIQVGGVGLLLMLLFLQRDSGMDIHAPVILLPAMLLVAWAIVSMLWAVNEYEATVKILDWSAAVLAGLLFLHVLSNKEDVRLFCNIVLAVAVVLLFIGYMQYFFNVRWVDQYAPPSITFNNKNMAAQYTLLLLPIAIGMGLCARSWWSLLLYFGIAIASAAFIMLGLTRGAIIAMVGEFFVLAFFLVVYGVYHRISALRRMVLVLALLMVLVFACLLIIAPEVVEGTYKRIKDTVRHLMQFQGETRFPIWANTVAMISDHLVFGVGAGNWMVYYPKYHLSVLPDFEVGLHRQHINTHQDYLEMTAELGLVGLALLLWFALSMLWVTMRLIARWRVGDVFLVIAFATAISGLLINSLGSFGLQQPLPVCMLMVYAGIMDYYWRTERDAKPRWVFQPKRFYGASIVLAAAGLVSIFALNLAWYKSEVHYRQALLASGRDVNQLLFHGEQALKYAPGRTRAMNFVARAYTEKGDRQKSLDSYDRILADYPYMLHTLDNAGIAFKIFGRRARAYELYTKLVEYRPLPHMYARAGKQLYTMGYVHEGVEYIRRAVAAEYGITRPGSTVSETEYSQLKSVVDRYDAHMAAQSEHIRQERAAILQEQSLGGATALTDTDGADSGKE